MTVDVRVLLPDEEADVLAAARAFCVSKGTPDAPEGDPLFELARVVHTLFRACIDHDSTEEKPEPFFASADQILASEALNRDNIFALYEQQQIWQDEVARQPMAFTEAEFEHFILSCEGDDPFPFVSLRPGKRWSFTRSMASLLRHSLTPRSQSSIESSTATASSEAKPTDEEPSG